MKLMSLGALVLGIASFVTYSNGASENSNNSGILNKSLVEDGDFFKNISFEGVFDGLEILKDFSVPITEQEGVREILSKNAGELFDHFSRDIKGVISISYHIVHNGDKLNFTKFTVVEGDLGDEQKDAPLREDCPDGLTHIKTCYSEACVQETLRDLANDFSSGETIYINHSGIGGAIICSDVK